MTEGDTTLAEIVRGHFDIDLVTRQNADTVFAHFAGCMGQHFVAIIQRHAKHGVGQDFRNDAFELKQIFFSHQVFSFQSVCGPENGPFL